MMRIKMNTPLCNKSPFKNSSSGIILVLLTIVIFILSVTAVLAVRLTYLSARQTTNELAYARAKLAAESALAIVAVQIKKNNGHCEDWQTQFGEKFNALEGIHVSIFLLNRRYQFLRRFVF